MNDAGLVLVHVDRALDEYYVKAEDHRSVLMWSQNWETGGAEEFALYHRILSGSATTQEYHDSFNSMVAAGLQDSFDSYKEKLYLF